MLSYTIFHNPGCSKSRQTLEILREHNIEPHIVEYLKTPPTRDEITSLLAKLGMKPGEVLRKKEPQFKKLGLNLDDAEQVLDALVKYPILLERPIVVGGDRAVIGRPPENVLEIL